MPGLSTLPTAETLVRDLNSFPLNQQILAKRKELIKRINEIFIKFSSILDKYREERHDGAVDAISEEEKTKIKYIAIEILTASNICIYPEVQDSVSLSDLGKIDEKRRVAYAITRLLQARYEDRINHYSLGFGECGKHISAVIASFAINLDNLLELNAFSSGFSHKFKKELERFTAALKDPAFIKRFSDDIDQKIEAIHTLLESIGRYDSITLVRGALTIQYQHEFNTYFRQSARKAHVTAALPEPILTFIAEHPDLIDTNIINRLSHEICKDPVLANLYELNRDYVSTQIQEAEKRSGIPLDKTLPSDTAGIRTPRHTSSSTAGWGPMLSPSHRPIDTIIPEAARRLSAALDDAAMGAGADSRRPSVSSTAVLSSRVTGDAIARSRSLSSSPSIV
ncbi:MAG: hypothetical protein Q7V63_04500 [Gammaproteobacteria bacterium]|nr:hypothetical protein [Gammaproteobacteria bacterium]